ncbi:unnamed protein product [Chrysodeixis includens]|uniref:Uncharacterized protein n=1 Tax=Chrysodeixis includens TaxID=689277 RepID=A0A9N8L209_CHRIL|nr:unnamed protein product [Chrysodeixis includens]
MLRAGVMLVRVLVTSVRRLRQDGGYRDSPGTRTTETQLHKKPVPYKVSNASVATLLINTGAVIAADGQAENRPNRRFASSVKSELFAKAAIVRGDLVPSDIGHVDFKSSFVAYRHLCARATTKIIL